MKNYLYLVKPDPAFEFRQAALQLEDELYSSLSLQASLTLQGHTGALYAMEGDYHTLQGRLKGQSRDYDLWCLTALPSLSRPGILILDMDMTSVQIEGIDELARRLGVFQQVSSITARAMQGGLDFASSLRARVALLKGGRSSVIDEVKAIMQETGGLERLLNLTEQAGWSRGICSGGFVQLIEVLEHKYRLQLVHANCLGFDDQGRLSGTVVGEIVDAEGKRAAVRALMERLHIPREQVIVLGDGANDLKMIGEAGLGIAYHAKPVVVEQAACALNCSDLTAVALFLQLSSELA